MQIDHEGDRQQCQGVGCNCKVPQGQQFCGEHCRIAASGKLDRAEEQDICACDHNECAERR